MAKHKRRTKGKGIFQDIDSFLKKTHLLSNIGSVLLPIAGGALGTFVAGGPGVGSAVGVAAGNSAVQGLKSLGYGRKKGKGVAQDLQSALGVYNTMRQPITKLNI